MNGTSLNLLVLRTADMDRAAMFYSKLGISFQRHTHGNGPHHLSATVDGFVFELYPLTVKSVGTSGTRIGFRVSSLDLVVSCLREIGTKILQEPAMSEWGRRCVIKDDDGHTIELIER